MYLYFPTHERGVRLVNMRHELHEAREYVLLFSKLCTLLKIFVQIPEKKKKTKKKKEEKRREEKQENEQVENKGEKERN